MKEDQNHHHHLRRIAIFSGKKYTRPTIFLLLLVLFYVWGYLSATLTIPKQPSPNLETTPLNKAQRNTTTRIPLSTTSFQSEADHFHFTTRCAEPVSSKLVRQTILNRIYNGTSPYEDFPPSYAGPLLRRKQIKGWGSTGAVFENLIRKVKPRTIIEVGTFLGASAIHMVELTRQLGLRTQILCVDDFRGWPGFRNQFRDVGMINGDVMLLYQFMQNVAYVNANESIIPIPFSTGTALQMLCEWGILGDLIEVDAGHDFHSAWSDINQAYKLLRPGGVIFGHDYFTAADNRGVRRAVNLFARVKGLRVKVDGQHWVIDSS